ncbi:transmembrane protein 127-like [Cylas formicarius]|uniref:transmembrane protein 127-like n=1 Tax=Cylas formicarius TaxID=197179 RepID=UPI00295888FC|nr:transmembrane protein 127-like [Cylas formicarius]
MSGLNCKNILDFFRQKDDERNLVSSMLHMFSITLISMSLVDLTWFSISGNFCVPYLTLGQFFWFGFTNRGINYEEYDCLTPSVVNLMRIIILLCFMAMIFSLVGFYLDLVAPKTEIYRLSRKYSGASVSTILFIMTIVMMSYYVVIILQDSIRDKYPNSDFDVSYGLGFYLLALAGGLQALNLLYTLLLPYKSSYQDDDRCLIDGFDDMDNFDSPTPPPPYSMPPPPYTP